MAPLSNLIPRILLGPGVTDVGWLVGWSVGRLVAGWVVYGTVWHWFCTCSGTVLALFWPVPALTWPVRASVYALVPPGVVRVSWHHPGHPHPGYTTRTTLRSPSAGVPAAPPAQLADVLLGSLLAAPVDRLRKLVTWPGITGTPHPLIGTLVSPPCVTGYRP